MIDSYQIKEERINFDRDREIISNGKRKEFRKNSVYHQPYLRVCYHQ